MHDASLGQTGLRVSVAGLGTGGFSRLGLKAGKTEDESARLIHQAVGLGINFIDTAPSYGTEGVVGKALKTIPRPGGGRDQGLRRNESWRLSTSAAPLGPHAGVTLNSSSLPLASCGASQG